MKKNLWFKLGLFCTALVLVATCFISSAWARYTTSATVTDSARVAKFDVDFKQGKTTFTGTAAEINLFGTELAHIYQGNTTAGNKNVNGTTKLIAPGSEGSATIEVVNTSEVDIVINMTATVTANNVPLQFSVKVGEGAQTSYSTDLESLLQDAVASVELAATNGTTASTTQVQIFWKWGDSSDETDTDLGESTPTCTVSIKLDACQILPN